MHLYIIASLPIFERIKDQVYSVLKRLKRILKLITGLVLEPSVKTFCLVHSMYLVNMKNKKIIALQLKKHFPENWATLGQIFQF